jgi:hypothetical protein
MAIKITTATIAEIVSVFLNAFSLKLIPLFLNVIAGIILF